MTTIDDSPGDQLSARLLGIGAELLSEQQREPYVSALALAGALSLRVGPAHLGLPMTAALLSWASTTADDPAMATALVEASRAYAAVWGQETQLAGFRAQLDAGGLL